MIKTILVGATFFLPFAAILIAKDNRILKNIGIAYLVAVIVIVLTV